MRKGFTLLELMIVIAVIAILVGIALPRLKGMQDEGNIIKAKGELKTIQIAVESYYIHNNNTYPIALANVTNATPRIVNEIQDDPFTNTTYSYVRGGTNNKYYIIYSAGPQGAGSAAITNNTVEETNGTSCIYISNMGEDSQP